MKLEDSLNGNYSSLYGEVVTDDIYHMRDVEDIVSINDPNHVHVKGHKRGLNFTPDVVLDLGGNVGIFSRYARELFPNALIVAVEPDPENCKVFREHTPHYRVMLIEKAIGHGKVYKCLDAANGAMECYFSNGPGYNESDLQQLKSTEVQSIMLTDLATFLHGKTLLKLDIEGNETVIFNDPESMKLLATFDYIAIELHYYAMDVEKYKDVKAITDAALLKIAETHHVERDNIYFYATKK